MIFLKIKIASILKQKSPKKTIYKKEINLKKTDKITRKGLPGSGEILRFTRQKLIQIREWFSICIQVPTCQNS